VAKALTTAERREHFESLVRKAERLIEESPACARRHDEGVCAGQRPTGRYVLRDEVGARAWTWQERVSMSARARHVFASATHAACITRH